MRAHKAHDGCYYADDPVPSSRSWRVAGGFGGVLAAVFAPDVAATPRKRRFGAKPCTGPHSTLAGRWFVFRAAMIGQGAAVAVCSH
jgi:hypothetical protein